MGRHALWRLRHTLVVGLSVLGFAPALVLSQGQKQGAGQATPPPVTRPPSPTIDGRILITSLRTRPPRLISDMVMPAPTDNPVTEAKAALGRRLFFDALLSNDRSVSCATCHVPDRAFTDERTLAVGVFGRVGKRHSPSLINRGFGRAQFWDGRAATLEAQVLQPISDPNEMDLSTGDAVARLAADESYRAAFQTVFERPVSVEDLGRALATYLRTIRSGDSPYDRFSAGATDALTAEQQAGLQIFRNKGRCIICHAEPTFTDEQFQNTGVAWRVETGATIGAYQDDGRFSVSGREQDRGKFKTPTLREVARTAPYMHDGSLATLADVVDFYDKGGRPNRNLFPLVRPIGLTLEEKQSLITFLESLSGVVSGK